MTSDITDVSERTEDRYLSLSLSNSFMATEKPPDVKDNVAITLNREYHELYKFTSPISADVIILVKIGTVIIASPLENNVANVYTVADLISFDTPNNLDLILFNILFIILIPKING